MQSFLFNNLNYSICQLKQIFRRYKNFFLITLIISILMLIIALTLAFNKDNISLCNLFDPALYRFITKKCGFFNCLFSKIFSLLLLIIFYIIIFSNARLSFLCHIVNAIFVFKLFYNFAVFIICFGIFGFIFGLICILIPSLITFFILLIFQCDCYSKLHSQCRTFCFNYNFLNVFFCFLILVILTILQCLLFLIFCSLC